MEQIFRVILSLSISGGLVGLLILLFRPLTRRYFAKKWTYYLWLLLLVRLLVPIHGDINLMGQLSAMMTAENRRISVETESGYVENAEKGSLQISVEGASESGRVENAEMKKQAGIASSMESAEGAEEIQDVEVVANIERDEAEIGVAADGLKVGRRADIFEIAGMIWILGVLLTAVYRIHTYRNFVKEINAGCTSVTAQNLLYKNAEMQTRLRLAKEVSLYENAAINTPMLIGFRRPHIVLPSKLLAEMAEKENDIALILHHELIHYKRRDIWYKWLFQAALCVHWFNPLLYLFNRKFNVDCELSCDEAMMALLSENGRRMYGNVLLDVAEKNLSEETFAMHRNVPMMTLIEEKCTLKERLREIAKFHKKGIMIGFCSALILAAFAAVAVVCGVADVRVDSGDVFVMRNESSGIVSRVLQSIPGIPDISDIPDISFGEPMLVNKSGNPYRMYDDDELIAGESEHDTWQARNYYGGEKSANVDKFTLNGSDALWILYTNKETTLEISSTFNLRDGRFKFVWVKPDQTVQTLNESGEKNTVKITLSQGRNVIKMVGQKARVEDIRISYEGMIKEDFDGIYFDENTEYAYLVLEGKKSIDVSRLDEACLYLKAEEVSKLSQIAWKEGVVLSEEIWQDLFIYSNVKETAQYLLEELEAGGVEEFDSRMLVQIAPYLNGEDLTALVLALEKDELAFHDLRDDLLPYLGDEQFMQCIIHYIDLGNVLSDSQLNDVRPYVSEEDFYRLIEYNGKKK